MKNIIVQFVIIFVIIVNVLSDKSCNETVENYAGDCAFPCSNQDRIYKREELPNANRNVRSGDPTTFTVLRPNGKIFTFCKCVHRSGQFTVISCEDPESDDGATYRCLKDVARKEDKGDFIIRYQTPFKSFRYSPSICQVCTGLDMTLFISRDVGVYRPVGDVPPLGCNIPSECAVTQPGQIQCEQRKDSDKIDNGLCCEKDKKYHGRSKFKPYKEDEKKYHDDYEQKHHHVGHKKIYHNKHKRRY